MIILTYIYIYTIIYLVFDAEGQIKQTSIGLFESNTFIIALVSRSTLY